MPHRGVKKPEHNFSRKLRVVFGDASDGGLEPSGSPLVRTNRLIPRSVPIHKLDLRYSSAGPDGRWQPDIRTQVFQSVDRSGVQRLQRYGNRPARRSLRH